MKYDLLRLFQILSLVFGLFLSPFSLKAMDVVKDTKESPSQPRLGRSLTVPAPLRQSPTKSPTSRKTSLEGDFTPAKARRILKVLIIEDLKMTIQFLQLYLNSFKPEDYFFEIYLASKGQKGIDLHREKKPFMTICDFNLKGKLNGGQVLEQIRTDCAIEGSGRVPGFIVAISAQEENNKKMSPNFTCQKPVTRALFNVAIEKALQYQQELDKQQSVLGNDWNEMVDKCRDLKSAPNEGNNTNSNELPDEASK